jgi:hypothetical protein
MPRGFVMVLLAAVAVAVPTLAPLAPNRAVLIAMAVAAGTAADLAAYFGLPSSKSITRQRRRISSARQRRHLPSGVKKMPYVTLTAVTSAL